MSRMVAHLYLSPHLDDAVLSCGGLIAMQDGRDEPISILTAFAGDPPDWRITPFAAELHARWGKPGPPIAVRRAEDRLAAGRLGASVVHLDLLEAIYRRGDGERPLYPDRAAIFGSLDVQDADTLNGLIESLGGLDLEDARLYCPLGIGGHVDHRLVRLAAEALHKPLTYYREFPYASRGEVIPEDMGDPPGSWRIYPITDEALQAWGDAILEYGTQLSTFWTDEDSLFNELRDFVFEKGGVELLEPDR
jgi:LmbE family N-acetylglucosaminyl deacetylase